MKRLIAIQQGLKVPKNQYNDFSHFNYRSIEDIEEALKPLLKEQKCSIKFTDQIVLIGDRYYVKSSCILKGEDGKIIDTTDGYAREAESKKGMDSSQLTGATSSYARKYAAGGLFGIDDTKDGDNDDNTQNGTQEAKKGTQEAKKGNKPSIDDKPWLNTDMPEFADYKKKNTPLTEIRKTFKVSKQVAALFENKLADFTPAIYKAMADSISKGKINDVEKALPKYNINESQAFDIQALITKKKQELK